MQTYRDLFRAREFSSLFVALSVRNAAETMSGLALATLVYGRTGSALLAALAMFGSSFAQVVGAMTLLSIADRVAPRAALSVIGLTLAIVTAGMAVPGSPVWLLLTIELAGGLVTAASGGVVWGLVNEIVPNGAWVLGRSVFNASVGITQIAGFATGGALLHFTSARGALWVACGLYVASVVLVRSGLAARPPRASGRPSVRETWAGNVRLWSSPARRSVYLALWVPNGLIVGCEAIFVAYAPNSAAALFVAAGVGMLAGDITVGRLLGRGLRARLITPLRVLLAAPYLLLIASPAPAVAVVPVAIASLGYSAGLLLQERLIALTPDAIRGQALGLHSAGMRALQACGATLAGCLAGIASPGTAMAILATASLVITVALTAGLRRPTAMSVPAPCSDVLTSPPARDSLHPGRPVGAPRTGHQPGGPPRRRKPAPPGSSAARSDPDHQSPDNLLVIS